MFNVVPPALTGDEAGLIPVTAIGAVVPVTLKNAVPVYELKALGGSGRVLLNGPIQDLAVRGIRERLGRRDLAAAVGRRIDDCAPGRRVRRCESLTRSGGPLMNSVRLAEAVAPTGKGVTDISGYGRLWRRRRIN